MQPQEFLYADEADMQHLLDRFSNTWLKISLSKPKVMFTPVPEQAYIKPNIFVNGTQWEVNASVYLGSMIAGNVSFDSEIFQHIQKASNAFERLKKRAWANHHITRLMKVSIIVSQEFFHGVGWFQVFQSNTNLYKITCFQVIISI